MDAIGLIVYSPVRASITPYHYYGRYLSQDVLTLKEGQDMLSLSGDCNHFITKVITNAECNISTLLITRPIGSWLGRINNSTLGFTNICPSGNCRSTTIAINVSFYMY